MGSIDRAATLASRSLAGLAIVAIVVLLVLVSADVFFRYVLNAPLLFAEEVSGYLVALIGYFGAAETLRVNRHIRVEVLTNWLAEPLRLWSNAAANAIGLVVVTIFCWHALVFVDKSFTRETVSASILAVPLWIPQSAMLIGMFAFLLQLAAETARSTAAIRHSGRTGTSS